MTPIRRRLLYIFRDTLLRLRISWEGGASLTISVGYHVDRTDQKGRPKWDGMRCRLNTTHGPDKVPAAIINNAIEDLEQRVQKAFYIFESEDRIPTKDDLKNAIDGKQVSSSKDFFVAFDEFIAHGISERYWADGTTAKVRASKKILCEFDKDITLEGISETKLHEFVNFLISRRISQKEGKENYTNASINKFIRVLKWFLRWADKKGYNPNQAFRAFSPALKMPENQVIFLKWDELMEVYKHDFSDNPEWEITRDCFCLCCFTSLRYSDLANLRKSDIGADSLTITTVKTSDTITIDLNKYSRSILDKYKNTEGPKALPVPTLQKMNTLLKRIARACGIDTPISVTSFTGRERKTRTVPKYELISTHCGRRTFICNALSMGIPPNVVMKWTGHSDYNAMRPYIDIADDIRRQSMHIFDKI